MKLGNLLKFGFWLVVSLALFGYAASQYANGTMANWYYYRAGADGYAINDQTFLHATQDNPVYLTVAPSQEISGPLAVPVKKGDLLPRGANGVIAASSVKDAKRVALDGDKLKMMMPTQIREDKGFQYLDSYKHKNIETNPWSGVWNLVMILTIGFSLGMLAQSVTDLLGIKYKKIQHFQPSEAGH